MFLPCAILAAHCAAGLAAPPGEYEVKAALIHNIAKFIAWPHPTSGRLKFCIVGDDPFGSAVEALRDKPVDGMTWEVLPPNGQPSLRECGVLFITASESGKLARILDDIKGSAVLTVGDTGGYAEQGVVVNFYLDQNKVRFEINTDAARRAGLKVSAQLLRLARVVQESGRAR